MVITYGQLYRKLRELLEDAMEDRFPLTLDELTLHAAGTMQISGKAERDRFLEILDSADAELIIPMNPHCESLNAAVAATIVMWEFGNR